MMSMSLYACLNKKTYINREKTELFEDILSASVSVILPMSVTVDLGINIITQNVKSCNHAIKN